MTTLNENMPTARRSTTRPMLRINRLNHIRINAKILDSTDEKLKKYLQFASEKMDTKVTSDDVVEYSLTMLFDRDSAFKSWLKRKE